MRFLQFDKLFSAIKLSFANFKIQFANFFKNSRLFQFFRSVDKNSLPSRIFNQLKLGVKDFIIL